MFRRLNHVHKPTAKLTTRAMVIFRPARPQARARKQQQRENFTPAIITLIVAEAILLVLIITYAIK